MLSSIHALLCNYSIPHCFATTPHRCKVKDDDEWLEKTGLSFKNYSNRRDKRKSINLSCRLFCEKFFIDCIDMESQVDNSDFFYDDLHLTNRASPIVGKVLFDNLNKLGAF